MGNRLVRFTYEGNFYQILDKIGTMPLPHYITHELEDKERYQNVYSRGSGGLLQPPQQASIFTPALLEKIRQKGVRIAFVTLHVGLGTFRPVKAENITDHKMHSEHYSLDAENAALIKQNQGRGKKGHCCRYPPAAALWNPLAQRKNCIRESSGWTDIFYLSRLFV